MSSSTHAEEEQIHLWQFNAAVMKFALRQPLPASSSSCPGVEFLFPEPVTTGCNPNRKSSEAKAAGVSFFPTLASTRLFMLAISKLCCTAVLDRLSCSCCSACRRLNESRQNWPCEASTKAQGMLSKMHRHLSRFCFQVSSSRHLRVLRSMTARSSSCMTMDLNSETT